MTQPHRSLRWPVYRCSPLSAPRSVLFDQPRRTHLWLSARHNVSSLPWDRLTTESVIVGRRGLLFLRARIHWPPSTLRRDRRDLFRSPAVLRPCLSAFAGSCWAPDHQGSASMCIASPFGHVSNSPPQPTGFCGCNWRANCRKSWRGARFSIRPVTH